ncbi:hypothetical protein BaRGS_00032412, partial [Batillaria attramentaria]
ATQPCPTPAPSWHELSNTGEDKQVHGGEYVTLEGAARGVVNVTLADLRVADAGRCGAELLLFQRNACVGDYAMRPRILYVRRRCSMLNRLPVRLGWSQALAKMADFVHLLL